MKEDMTNSADTAVSSQEKGTPFSTNAYNTVLSNAVILLLNAFTGIITARYLGPFERGVYSLVIVSSSLSALVLSFGIPYFISCNSLSICYKPSIIYSIMKYWALIGIALLLFVSFCMLLIPITSSNYTVVLVALSTVIGVPMLLNMYYSSMLQGYNRIYAYNVTRLSFSFLYILALFVLVAIDQVTVVNVIVVYCIVTIVVVIYGRNKLSGIFTSQSQEQIKAPRKKAFTFGMTSLVSQFIGSMNLRLDYIIANHYCGTEGLGQYSVSVAAASMLWQIPAAVAAVLIPKLASQRGSSASVTTLAAIRAYVLISLPILAAAIVLAPLLIRTFYGEDYRMASSLFLILLPGSIVFGIAHITTSFFAAYCKKPSINTGLASTSLLINIIANIILAPKYGLYGVAISCSISYILSTMMALVVFLRMSMYKVKMLVPRRGDIDVLGSIIVRAFNELVRRNRTS